MSVNNGLIRSSMDFAKEALINFDPSKLTKEEIGQLFYESLEMGVNALSSLNSPTIQLMMMEAGRQVIHV